MVICDEDVISIPLVQSIGELYAYLGIVESTGHIRRP